MASRTALASACGELDKPTKRLYKTFWGPLGGFVQQVGPQPDAQVMSCTQVY